jgi:hypothetical protein
VPKKALGELIFLVFVGEESSPDTNY